jgi:hypothetical protein
MSEFREKIKTLNDQFPVILSDYKRNYDLYSNDNKDQTKLNAYNTSNSQVAKCIRDMTDITVQLRSQNKEFDTIMTQLNTLIADEQKKNTELKERIEYMKNVNNGSATLVSDYKENYNETNLRNWAMFIGILVICISSLKVFIIPTSAEGILMIKNKKIQEAKELFDNLQGLARDINKQRNDYIIKERLRKENEEYNKEYDKQRLLARAKLDAQRGELNK